MFPSFRRNLEEPIIAVLGHIYRIYKSEADFNKDRVDQDNMPPKYKEARTLVVQAQIFYNFLLDESQICSDSLKQRLESSESLQYYATPENRQSYQATTSKASPDRPEMRRCLYIIPYSKLNLQVGFMKTVEIEAGAEFSTVINVDAPSCIVSIMLQTEAYDI